MATINMSGVLAFMLQTEAAVTFPDGSSYTVPVNTPITTAHSDITVTGAKVALMRNAKSVGRGEPVQVFSIDEIVTT